ncbi:23S rRNA (adenine(2030)-N(6))-methyltransferase RlmJ [Parachitinimonas caeni]|uniref:Ribosomal RNA large subunit methyltransferase J n=1 Tax=Parachitinimonas caeni TaxID=3031301 RepID=A0ABT7DTK1_9NEIS|nr:23S rRNA (adenine(2030)-N(6))-methyltransferase RlmJ [Parachitinimonas caeni]MDK2123411.1 23S rRNA (adenine(2030)-N(6))-methyltransferase RlmJ [Parachitinimonas caeni]
MLSYRHAFHAGNHADVLKHFILVQLLQYLGQKDKPFWYVDTHAGAGCYQLDTGYAAKNAEYLGGIDRLWQRNDLPEAIQEYVEVVRTFNPDGKLRFYPGSPMCALNVMRSTDKLRLFELHSTDSGLLAENMRPAGRQVGLQAADGFAGLKAVLPPPPRRGLILIDPPYEDKRDYQRVVAAMQESLQRFATGTYAIWYPLLQRHEAMQLPEKLHGVPCKSWLNVSLTVRRPSSDGFGMHGSGMYLFNPPWRLPELLKEVMPWLTAALAEDDGASYRLDFQMD